MKRVIVTSKLVHQNGIPEGTLRTKEDFFSDQRSYMSELWYFEDITNVTYYFPADDPLSGSIANDKSIIEKYLIFEKKLIKNETHYIEIMELDCKGLKIYSATVGIACADEKYCEAFL